jgi:hypothetical protein
LNTDRAPQSKAVVDLHKALQVEMYEANIKDGLLLLWCAYAGC